MTRFFYIALLTLIGFFLTPTDTYACGSKSENIENTCTKQSNTETEKKDCCDTEKGQCGKHGKDCGGKCKNPSCHCPTAPLAFALTLDAGMKNHIIVLENLTFGYTQSYISSGFHSIWQPPKIS